MVLHPARRAQEGRSLASAAVLVVFAPRGRTALEPPPLVTSAPGIPPALPDHPHVISPSRVPQEHPSTLPLGHVSSVLPVHTAPRAPTSAVPVRLGRSPPAKHPPLVHHATSGLSPARLVARPALPALPVPTAPLAPPRVPYARQGPTPTRKQDTCALPVRREGTATVGVIPAYCAPQGRTALATQRHVRSVRRGALAVPERPRTFLARRDPTSLFLALVGVFRVLPGRSRV